MFLKDSVKIKSISFFKQEKNPPENDVFFQQKVPHFLRNYNLISTVKIS